MVRRQLLPTVVLAALPFGLSLGGYGFALDSQVGAATTEDRTVEEVSAVTLAGVGRLAITTGERVLDHITTEIHDGVLVLDIDGPLWGDPGTVTYDLVLPTVEAITVDGAGHVDADLAAADSLAVHVSGAGGVTGHHLDVDGLTVEAAGGRRPAPCDRAAHSQRRGSREYCPHGLGPGHRDISGVGDVRAQ